MRKLYIVLAIIAVVAIALTILIIVLLRRARRIAAEKKAQLAAKDAARIEALKPYRAWARRVEAARDRAVYESDGEHYVKQATINRRIADIEPPPDVRPSSRYNPEVSWWTDARNAVENMSRRVAEILLIDEPVKQMKEFLRLTHADLALLSGGEKSIVIALRAGLARSYTEQLWQTATSGSEGSRKALQKLIDFTESREIVGGGRFAITYMNAVEAVYVVPENWTKVVCELIDFPTLDDFRLPKMNKGQIVELPSQALREQSIVIGKIVEAFWKSGKKYQSLIPSESMAKVADMLEAHRSLHPIQVRN